MRLRGAISGFGAVASKAHLAGWERSARFSISAVHDPIAARRHDALKLLPQVRVYDDLDLMLDGEAPDFVDVASPPGCHFDAVRSALTAGANVLVEKPLCLEPSHFDALVSLAAERRRVLMCVHNWKHAPAYALARRLIDEGRIGDVESIEFERLRTRPAGTGESGGRWRSAAASGGGILIDHGWHVFYLARWLTGGGAPQVVSCRLESRGSDSVEETADLRADLSEGRWFSVRLSWRAPERRTRTVVRGDKGAIDILPGRVTWNPARGASEEIQVADQADDSYHSSWFARMADEFEAAVVEGPASRVGQENLAEARAALRLIGAARESSRCGGKAVAV